METIFLSKFSKDLDKIKDSTILKKLAYTIEEIEQAKKLTDISNLKKLSGVKNAYRIKLGDYRIGVYFENNTIEFARIIHRKDVYKFFP